ncbi:hypothetical protein SPRG_08031 [Saprolegnia parasitica CBS 223.65]|uniref:PIPK domain-containing protein n=1 Tax=Saprolegnia parasitica (strain CBS 223.65) TaxID=695850 RepID=A0A067CIK5_SAPPC|nr:hypothetical protein SPRG_08031 [Saprolegnia parasitica CBS 223.65]KDO26627.1 hypothetical protein SPRG_08031 [Saprolegnia parasitica CBS 223.65]|eukprot:XP_012202766.1 hypothetical protein SPRG_08031 [Saprolegnia parasitica CBS 223.65]
MEIKPREPPRRPTLTSHKSAGSLLDDAGLKRADGRSVDDNEHAVGRRSSKPHLSIDIHEAKPPFPLGKRRSVSDASLKLSQGDVLGHDMLVSRPGSPAAKAIDMTNQIQRARHGTLLTSPTAAFKKPDGNEIHDQHEQYTLTYGMMTGILASAGSMDLFKQRLTMNDFMRVDKRNFPANPRSKLKHEFKFKDYAPDIFRQIRRRFDIDSADYLVTLCGDFNYIEFMSNSKSGQFFFYSHDGRFMIKTQTQGESKFLRRILPHYYKFVMENPNTLVTRFYGMHRVKMHHLKTQMHFVIMASVFNTPKEIHLRFDLKGSTVGRNASPDEKKRRGVLKDNDLIEEQIHLSLGPARRAMMLEQLRKDVAFLKRMKIMDYSLLVGIHDAGQEILAPGATLATEIDLAEQKKKLQQLQQPTVFGSAAESTVQLDDDDDDDDLGALDPGVPPPTSPRVDPVNKEPTGSIFCKDLGGIRGRRASGKKNGFVYFVGIIDILQQYNMQKRAETLIKGLQHNAKEISSVDPDLYGNRFIEFMEKFVLVDD